MRALVEARQAAEAEERDRLLYVAMTRAESWLIVGAAGNVGADPTESWHNMVRRRDGAAGAVATAFAGGEGLRLESGDWTAAPVAPAERERARVPRPDWLEVPVPAPARVSPRIAPSDLPGAKVLPGETLVDGETARRRGTAIHALLEHLPGLPAAEWDARAPAILDGLAGEAERPGVLAEARRRAGGAGLRLPLRRRHAGRGALRPARRRGAAGDLRHDRPGGR